MPRQIEMSHLLKQASYRAGASLHPASDAFPVRYDARDREKRVFLFMFSRASECARKHRPFLSPFFDNFRYKWLQLPDVPPRKASPANGREGKYINCIFGALLCSAPKMLNYPPLSLGGKGGQGGIGGIKRRLLATLFDNHGSLGTCLDGQREFFCLFFRAPSAAREKMGFFFPPFLENFHCKQQITKSQTSGAGT